jgi:hypothetical protein
MRQPMGGRPADAMRPARREWWEEFCGAQMKMICHLGEPATVT